MAEPLRRVGRYDLLEVIGRGGAAVVYLAYQPDLDRLVALKELAPHHAADPTFAQRFVEESRLAASLNNTSIVTVFEYFEHEGLPYIAMEYMPRGSLRGYLPALTGAALGGVLESVLEGLAYGERVGIVHRDLKPENLLVGGNGRVKIADFGVARALSSATPRPFATVTGTPIGTPAYMAPEQALGGHLTPATDLYSLGIIAWEALAGRTPFGSSDTPMAVLYQQVNEPIPAIETIRDDIHPGACRWLSRMLAKAPEDRYASAEESWDELEDVLIDMMGPRWRRDAAIGGPEEPTDEQEAQRTQADILGGGPLGTPAIFSRDSRRDTPVNPLLGENFLDDSGEGDREDEDDQLHLEGEGRPRPQISAVLTPDPLNSPVPVPLPELELELEPLITILPENAPLVDDLRSFRSTAVPALRGARATPPARSRLVAGVLVAVLAGVVGALIGSGSSPGPLPSRAPVTRTTALDTLALQVGPVVGALASDTASAVQRFDAGHTLTAQSRSAMQLADRYGAADKQLKALPPASQTLPELSAVERDLASLSTDWREVAADAVHNRRTRFAATVKKLSSLETRLATDAADATRG
jgi:serine/threonine protein kinase